MPVRTTTRRRTLYSGNRYASISPGRPRRPVGAQPKYEATRVLKLLRRDEGQGLAEYALILSLIAIIAIVALVFLGSQVSSLLSTVGQSV